MAGGNKFEIPFDMIVAFSTNLNPASLADEAFMRRIQTKVKVGYVTYEQFHEISRRVCAKSGLEYDGAVVDGFTKVLADLRQPLRACYPRDIIQHICWKAKYEDVQPLFTLEAIREACDRYFLGLALTWKPPKCEVGQPDQEGPPPPISAAVQTSPSCLWPTPNPGRPPR